MDTVVPAENSLITLRIEITDLQTPFEYLTAFIISKAVNCTFRTEFHEVYTQTEEAVEKHFLISDSEKGKRQRES